MKKMKVTIRKDGTQTVEVLNAEGKDCVEFTRAFEQRLGTQVGERELKPEYEMEPGEYESETVQEGSR